MSTKTTYMCDRCGASRDSADTHKPPLLWSVSLKATPYGSYSYGGYDPAPRLQVDWCQPCCELMGLKLEFPFKKESNPISLSKEQLDSTVKEVLRGVLRRGLDAEAPSND